MRTSLLAGLAAAPLIIAQPPLAVAETPEGVPVSQTSEGTTSVGAGSTQMDATEQNARSALEKAGYTQIRDVVSSAEGISAKALKDGKEVSLVVDSGGRIRERQQ